MTSFSPFRTTPLSTSLAAPRAPSNVPVPVESGKLCLAVGTAVRAARSTLMTPSPWAWGSAAGSGLAVVISRALTWSGVRPGRCCSSSAAAPEATAAAWEVPLPRKNRSSKAAVAP